MANHDPRLLAEDDPLRLRIRACLHLTPTERVAQMLADLKRVQALFTTPRPKVVSIDDLQLWRMSRADDELQLRCLYTVIDEEQRRRHDPET